MSQITVAKFGGTSVANYEAMCRCADIVLNNPSIRLVAVSASSGVTNYLVKLGQGVQDANERKAILQHISEIEHEILKGLNNPAHVAEHLEQYLVELSELAATANIAENLALKDELLSYGERMSSLLFSTLLEQKSQAVTNLDVRTVLKTDGCHGKAEPQVQLIKERAESLLLPSLSETVFVTQGFLGSNERGKTTTLGRGGSDYSAALLAEAIGADVLEIWTDVVGIYTTDPRLTSAAHPIPEISFDEAAEMATFGAKILHPATLIPAMRTGTRVFVGSSRAPDQGGTWILKQVTEKPAYRAIALRKQQTLVTVKSPQMLHATGFLSRVFGILSKHNISVDLVTTSEISIALTLDTPPDSPVQHINEACLAELRDFCEVTVETNLSLVALIGNHLNDSKGVGANVFNSLSGINMRLICHGASAHNLCFLIRDDEATSVVEQLHKALFE